MSIPNVLLLVALPEEFRLKEWEKELNDLDGLKKEINNFANPSNSVNLIIEFASVGKVNITNAFYQSLLDNSNITFDHVINIGSVGGITDEKSGNIQLGEIVRIKYAMQTDLDLTGIGENTIGSNRNSLNLPHDNSSFYELKSPIVTPEIRYAVCGSSDRFPIALTSSDSEENNRWYNVIAPNQSKVNMLDQEIAALAASVELYNYKNPQKKIPSLISLKYVANLVTRDSIENPQNATQNAKDSATEWEDSLKNDQSCQEKSLKSLKFLVEKISEHHSQKSI